MKAADLLKQGLTKAGDFTCHPAAFLIAVAYLVCWLIFDRASFDMHGAAAMATWFMTLFIQRAESRDTQAIQAKLDQLLRAQGVDSRSLQKLDEKEPEQIAERRKAETEKSQPAAEG